MSDDAAAAELDGPPGPDGVPQAVHDIGVEVRVVLGRNVMPVSQLLKLGRGAVVELDHALRQPVSLYVGNLLIARGEVIILSEDRLGVSITKVLTTTRGDGA